MVAPRDETVVVVGASASHPCPAVDAPARVPIPVTMMRTEATSNAAFVGTRRARRLPRKTARSLPRRTAPTSPTFTARSGAPVSRPCLPDMAKNTLTPPSQALAISEGPSAGTPPRQRLQEHEPTFTLARRVSDPVRRRVRPPRTGRVSTALALAPLLELEREFEESTRHARTGNVSLLSRSHSETPRGRWGSCRR
jgi:hypothetical protein